MVEIVIAIGVSLSICPLALPDVETYAIFLPSHARLMIMFSLEFFAGYALAAESRRIVVTGQEGTEEIPECFLELVTLLSREKKLLVALDLPKEPRVSGYFEGEITGEELLAAPFWRIFDGRSSRASLDLLKELRRLQLEGRVKVVLTGRLALNEVVALFDDLDKIDESAECIVTFIHTEERWDLSENRVWSLEIRPSWGSAWYCTRFGCGARPLRWFQPQKGHPNKEEGILERRADLSYTLWIAPSSTSFPALM